MKQQFTFTDLRLSLGLFGLLAEANAKSTAKVDYFIHQNTKKLRTAWDEYVKAEDNVNREHLKGEDFNGFFLYQAKGKDDSDVLYVAQGMFFQKVTEGEGFLPHTGKKFWETEPDENGKSQKMHYTPVSDDIEKYQAELGKLQEESKYDFEPYQLAGSEMPDLKVDWTKSAEAKELLYDKYIDHER